MKILIVVDNTDMRQMIRRFIRDMADEIEECADGDEVLSAYKLLLPDWVLLDIELKESGGFGAAKQIKESFPHAAIIFLASFDDAGLRTMAREIGAKGFILKENLAKLREVISEH